MTYLDLTLPTPAANLALDEALLLEAENQGGELLRVWEWPTPVVVLGAAGKLAEDVDEHACQRDDIPILRRSSGGGTVLLGKGCLCFSLVLAYNRAAELTQVASSYRYILGLLADAFSKRIPRIEPAGTSDLAWQGRKFSGNSQQRKRRHLLHHGTLLYDFDLELSERYLLEPSRQPEYRRQRKHTDFLINLPIAGTDLRKSLCDVWEATETSSCWPEDSVRRLVDEKYTKSEWLRRR